MRACRAAGMPATQLTHRCSYQRRAWVWARSRMRFLPAPNPGLKPHLLRGLPVEVVHQPQVQLVACRPPCRGAHQQPAVAAKAELHDAGAAGPTSRCMGEDGGWRSVGERAGAGPWLAQHNHPRGGRLGWG